MPKLQRQFHLEVTPEQFLNACSPEELQEIELLLQGNRLSLRKAGGDPADIQKWMRRYSEGNYPVEGLLSCADHIDADRMELGKQEKFVRLIAITQVLTTYKDVRATEAAQQVMEIAKKYR